MYLTSCRTGRVRRVSAVRQQRINQGRWKVRSPYNALLQYARNHNGLGPKSLDDVDERPEGVGENDLWTEVDLYEQTIAAYEGDRLVFATLISSGLNRWPTYQGLFNVDPENRFQETKMGGAEGQVDYYFVEDVPHTMYFDLRNEIALHGAYWHDRFGYKHSHGCVNMPPQDSEWIYYWSQDHGEEDFWVYVWESNPQQYFERYDPEDPFVGA